MGDEARGVAVDLGGFLAGRLGARPEFVACTTPLWTVRAVVRGVSKRGAERERVAEVIGE